MSWKLIRSLGLVSISPETIGEMSPGFISFVSGLIAVCIASQGQTQPKPQPEAEPAIA